jgi:hypothetical protein
MSSHSNVSFVRSGPAPRVDAATLAAVLRSAAELRCIRDGSPLYRCLNVRFGSRVDQDRKSTSPASSRMVGGVQMMTLLPYPWDLSIAHFEPDDTSALLAGEPRSIYRAEICLGGLSPDIRSLLTRDPSPENDHPLRLESVSIAIGPIQNATLSSPVPVHVGWVALHVSGPGNFYPWAPGATIDRVRSVPELAAIAKLLESAWPVSAAPSIPRTLLGRIGERVRPRAAWQWIAGECG